MPFPHTGKQPKGEQNKALVAERKRQAWELYKAGVTNFAEIARQLDVTRNTIWRYVHQGLNALAKDSLDDTRQYRDLEVARCDAQLANMWPLAVDPQQEPSVRLRAHEVVLRVAERRARLLGLDAAEKREHTGKDGAPIEFCNLTPEELRARVLSLLDSNGTGPADSGGTE
jgi:transposase-like protein